MPSHKRFRFPPLTEGNNPLTVLRPLLIPGMVEPVQDGDGGINIQIATDDPDGVLCVINPYLPPMSEGDKLEIYCNGTRVRERFVEADEVNQRVFFYLPTPVESGWLENCHYVLTRKGETEADPPSVALRIWVKLYKPGNFDRHPNDEDGHSELNIVQLPPELVEQGVIDAEWAKKGVLATIPHYVYCTRNDKVRLQLGEYLIPAHRITPEQAEGQQPIEILIDQDAILGAGDGLRLVVKYDIIDEVGNWADRHSQRTYIDVDAGGWRLEAPIIREALNGVITIRDLNKQPVTIQIHVSSQYFGVGDSVKMTFIGTPPYNAEPLICSETRDIDNVPSVLEIEVPYELIRAIAQGRADASYILYKKDGGDPISSRRALARVEGDVNMLPEPSIRELLGDTLEPDQPYATVDVRYAMKNGDLICLRWTGIKSNGDAYLHEVSHIVSDNEAKEGLVTFDINAEHISVLDNGTLDLSYVVANDAPGLLDIRESERLLAKVGKIRATLPAPEVEEADPPGDVLDPSKVFERVHVWISEAKTLKGDVLTFYWRSPNPFASTSDWLPITTVTEGQPVRFPVDVKFVTANIGNSVRVLYTLWRAATQRNEYSAALDLRVAGWISPTLTDITDSKGTIAPGGITFDTSVTVTGTASQGQTVQLYDGNTALTPDVPVDADGNWSRVISGLSPVAHPIKAKALYGAQPESAVRSFTVAQTVTPVISNITDSKGTIAPGGITFDTSVTVTGTASQGQTVQLYDGNTALTPDVPVDADGNWSRVISGLSPVAHPIKAKALYGAQPESAVRSFTVAQTVTPAISNITDSKGTIAPGGITFDTSVTVTGKASPRQPVRLYDGNTALTPDVPVDADGNWSRLISGLSPVAHPIKAKALYGAQPESAVRSFTVAQTVTPAISNITDSKGTIAPGGITFDTSVTVTGTASPRQTVRLYDGNTALTPDVPVDADGNWSRVISGLSPVAHPIKAKALYGAQPESAVRSFTVAQTVTPAISNITDSKGTIAPGGITFDTSVTVTGTASPRQTVRLYDGNTALTPDVPVDADGNWSRVISGLSPVAHPIKAKALYGAQPESAVRAFTATSGLKRDFTDFANQNWNGWVGGPGVDPRDLQLRNVGGNWRFHNYTYTGKSNGVIIQKTLSNLQPRYQYRFSIKAIRYEGASATPSLSIRAAGSLVAGPTQISSLTNWITLSGTFTPTTSSITVDVYSNVATGIGNDYEIDDIEIVLI